MAITKTAARMTNANIWDTIRSKFPSFASHTSQATAELFTDRGFEALKRTDVNALNEYFQLSLQVKLLDVEAAHATNRLEKLGFGESFDAPFGGILQKIAVPYLKPLSPAYLNLENGKSVDPFVIRKTAPTERFFRQNYSFQSAVTIPDDSIYKNIFTTEYGMSYFAEAQMEALHTGYTVQQYQNMLEALNNGFIHSTKYPVQDTQKLTITLSESPTDEELRAFVLAINNAVSALELDPITDAFNSMKFATTQDVSTLKLLLRPGIKNAIANIPALNAPGLSLNVDIIEVPNFGGLVPYADSTYTTQLYPIYDTVTGEEIGWTKTEGSSDVYTGDVYYRDPNADVIGILADKGLVFHGIQNPYRVEPQRNGRGLYTNFWASSPNNTIAVDPIKNAILIQKA